MTIMSVENLSKHYEVKRPFKPPGLVKALDGVTFDVRPKKTLGIVGESGCGKSTLARQLMHLEVPTTGSIKIEGKDIRNWTQQDLVSKIQMIFQDPYNSINPRKKAWQIVAEPLLIQGQLPREECYEKAVEMMIKVGLRPQLAERYPHMFSGGQRQRLGIARALISGPQIILCDEPVSALDVSIQAQVLNLLMELQDSLGLTYLFISHDLSVVKHISDEILVMYLGKVVEYGPRDQIFNNPQHPYTQALLAASPGLLEDKEHEPLQGELPSPLNPPSGCAFHKRCPKATANCEINTPKLREINGRLVACDEI